MIISASIVSKRFLGYKGQRTRACIKDSGSGRGTHRPPLIPSSSSLVTASRNAARDRATISSATGRRRNHRAIRPLE
jgi:hypothetical protein